MKIDQRAILSLLFVAGSAVWLAPAKQPAPEVADLVSRGRKIGDIRSAGAQPFQLRGTIKLFNAGRGQFEGTYTLLWVSPEKWRETISLPGYSRERILDGSRMWQQESPQTTPLQVFELARGLNFTQFLALKTGRKDAKVKSQKQGGTRQWCFKNGDDFEDQTLCFDATSGVLLSATNFAGETELSNFEPWGGRLFPETVRVDANGFRIAEFDLGQLTDLNQPNDEIFSPPQGARESPGCQDPDLPKLLGKPSVNYPSSAMRDKLAGIVRVLSNVGIDGKLADARVAASPSPSLSAAVLQSLPDRNYQPATCSGVPIPFQIEIDVDFSLQE